MSDRVFPPEMMYHREQQLISALLDCAGVYYDINLTQNRILGDPKQVVDGVEYSILDLIGKPRGCTYTEIIDYWLPIMPEDERQPFALFSDIARIHACYEAGQRVLCHKFWTQDVLGNRMLAEQKIRLYKDTTTGDLLGLVYVSNDDKYAALEQKEARLTAQYAEASSRASFLEAMSANVPGGYHRCTTKDGFSLEYVSDGFLEIVGWTREEIARELSNRFINLVAPEDQAFFMSLEPELSSSGKINCVYRIRRKDGTRRWVQDSTLRVRLENQEYYQCTLADITDFVQQQEELSRKNMELQQQKSLMETMERNMPAGYHRCKPELGCPFLYIGEHFSKILGYSREEIEQDFDNLYVNLLWPEDADALGEYEDMRFHQGMGNLYHTSVYRMKHKNGGYRWVTDSTMFMDLGEDSFLQGVISDITEYMESLNEAKQRAEASNQAKSTFLFNASHDIRTPMNAIQGFAHIIEENADNPAIVRDAIQKISQASNTLMTLMNDVLELARIEQGKDEINAQMVDLYENGKNLYEMFAGEMRCAGIRFLADGDAIHDRVYCDNLKLTRIMMNMLSNAKKFTPAGGTVTFGCNRISMDDHSATYRFFVRDTGIGMSREFQERAFQQFEQERSSTASGVTGSGLGLAITKKLVDLMGGTVAIDSELGKGTEISVTLTFPLVHEADTAAPKLRLKDVDMRGKRVLLVEDNEFNREITRYILEEMQFAVEEAENGAIAVDKLLRGGPGHFDVVLMDIQMPVMDGYTATKEIRNIQEPRIASVPIIAMTANAFDEDKQKCFAVGMNGHIGKPLDHDSFLRELSKVL